MNYNYGVTSLFYRLADLEEQEKYWKAAGTDSAHKVKTSHHGHGEQVKY